MWLNVGTLCGVTLVIIHHLFVFSKIVFNKIEQPGNLMLWLWKWGEKTRRENREGAMGYALRWVTSRCWHFKRCLSAGPSVLTGQEATAVSTQANDHLMWWASTWLSSRVHTALNALQWGSVAALSLRWNDIQGLDDRAAAVFNPAVQKCIPVFFFFLTKLLNVWPETGLQYDDSPQSLLNSRTRRILVRQVPATYTIKYKNPCLLSPLHWCVTD